MAMSFNFNITTPIAIITNKLNYTFLFSSSSSPISRLLRSGSLCFVKLFRSVCDYERQVFGFSRFDNLPYMPHGRSPVMELNGSYDIEHASSTQKIQHELWPLGPIDPKKARFPCCLVWTPLPVVSWLAPFIGHVGVCREDGTILDFSVSNFVNVDKFAFGSAARYLQLDREQCCFSPNLSGHSCKQGYKHAEFGTALTWDDALQSSVRFFEHKSYNLFTCNCHSFAANCLNRMSHGGSMDWNMVSIAGLILWKGRWVDTLSIVKAFLPFTVVLSFGVLVVGWPFLIGLLSFSFLLFGWFLFGTYCVKSLFEC